VRPTPVITEEVTASIEEMIQKKIVEVNYYPVLTWLGLPP
jgi:U3 small nucleolar ribonucleoprotein component